MGDEEAQQRTQLSADGLARGRQSLAFVRQEADRLTGKYPTDDRRAMPTLLGNRLRGGEDLAGTAWGLASIVAAPHISLVAAERDEQYLEDARSELDLAVRFCLVWGLATIVATVAFWRHGPWIFVPVATYALAYLSYRGAVVAAEEHGVALATLIDLNRFAFYDRMGVPRPKDVDEERKQNETLMRLLNGSTEANLSYANQPRSDAS